MKQNPYNAVLNLGHENGKENISLKFNAFLLISIPLCNAGTVTMWTPNMGKPAVKMLCHGSALTSLCVDKTGNYLITTGRDYQMKIWDIRTYKELYSYYTRKTPVSVDISQKGIISVAAGNTVQMWKNCLQEKQSSAYMQHIMQSGEVLESVRFCPYEDILGIGHSNGFSSIVIPGAGEPNFDSFVDNPFQSTKQRKEAEVKKLLDKVFLFLNMAPSILWRLTNAIIRYILLNLDST